MNARAILASVLVLAAAPAFASLASAPVPDQLVIRELRQRLAVLEDATPRASVVGAARHAETIDQLAGIKHLVTLADEANDRRVSRAAEREAKADLARRLQVVDTILAMLSVAMLTLLFLTRRKA